MSWEKEAASERWSPDPATEAGVEARGRVGELGQSEDECSKFWILLL